MGQHALQPREKARAREHGAEFRHKGDQVELRRGGFRTRVFQANGRAAVIAYGRTADDETWRPHSLQVLEVSDGAIALIVAFVGPLAPSLFSGAGLSPDPPATPN